jgi:hypothetical protein
MGSSSEEKKQQLVGGFVLQLIYLVWRIILSVPFLLYYLIKKLLYAIVRIVWVCIIKPIADYIFLPLSPAGKILRNMMANGLSLNWVRSTSIDYFISLDTYASAVYNMWNIWLYRLSGYIILVSWWSLLYKSALHHNHSILSPCIVHPALALDALPHLGFEYRFPRDYRQQLKTTSRKLEIIKEIIESESSEDSIDKDSLKSKIMALPSAKSINSRPPEKKPTKWYKPFSRALKISIFVSIASLLYFDLPLLCNLNSIFWHFMSSLRRGDWMLYLDILLYCIYPIVPHWLPVFMERISYWDRPSWPRRHPIGDGDGFKSEMPLKDDIDSRKEQDSETKPPSIFRYILVFLHLFSFRLFLVVVIHYFFYISVGPSNVFSVLMIPIYMALRLSPIPNPAPKDVGPGVLKDITIGSFTLFPLSRVLGILIVRYITINLINIFHLFKESDFKFKAPIEVSETRVNVGNPDDPVIFTFSDLMHTFVFLSITRNIYPSFVEPILSRFTKNNMISDDKKTRLSFLSIASSVFHFSLHEYEEFPSRMEKADCIYSWRIFFSWIAWLFVLGTGWFNRNAFIK